MNGQTERQTYRQADKLTPNKNDWKSSLGFSSSELKKKQFLKRSTFPFFHAFTVRLP